MSGELSDCIFEFGPFRLDPTEHTFQRGDEILPLTPKAFEALLILVQNGGRLVSKKELSQKLWPDTFVGATTLAQNIFTLRKVLDDNQKNPQYIKTIPKRGYRFVAKITESLKDPPDQNMEEFSAQRQRKAEGAFSESLEYSSLAVLPLTNANENPDLDYLSDGITESIINSLSQRRDLRIVARSIVFRYKGCEVEPQQVGRDLNVQQVLSGRLIQLGEKLIIKVELIDVARGWQIWGEQYDREPSDIVTVQKDIAERISEAFHLTLQDGAQKRIIKNYTENGVAYQLYLRGRYYWNKQTEEGCVRAVEFFEKAIKLDDEYTLAYTGLADAYISLDFYGHNPPREIMPKARAAALKALELDDTLAEAHTSIGCIKMVYDHDWETAEKEFQRAIKLKPLYPYAHSWYSLHLLAMGRFEESYSECKRALELDPLDIDINYHLGWYYLYARRYDKAIEQLRLTLEMEPNCFLARLLLGRAYEAKGDFSAAVTEFQKAAILDRSPLLMGFLGHAYAALGRKDKAGELLEELKDLSQHSYVPPYSLGLIYAGMNEKDKAFESFELGCKVGNEWMIYSKVNSVFDPFRSDPRFRQLLENMNLKAPATRSIDADDPAF